MMRDSESFTLTDNHIRLLSAANVRWDDSEWGAPCVDPKRPYGNSSGPPDVCRALGWPKLGDDGSGPCYSSDQCRDAWRLHVETRTALQVVLRSRSFVPGTYTRPLRCMVPSGPWVLASASTEAVR